MSAVIPPIVQRLAFVLLLSMALAACESNWQGRGPRSARGPSAESVCGGTMTVYSGDTVYSIARRCNVSVRELIEANSLQAPYVIVPGMKLRVPGGSGEYVVQRGDTLLVLARKLNVDFQALARTNGKSSPYTIFVGETLRVPGSYGGTVQTAQTPAIFNAPLVIASPNASAGAKPPSRAPTTTMSKLPPQAPLQPQIAARSEPEPTDSPAAPASTAVSMPAPVAEAKHAAFQPQPNLLPPPAPPPLAGKGFIWPVKGEVLNEFGPLSKGQHSDGVNIAAPRGTAVKAAENGVVAYVGNELKGFGNLLLIKHADGWMTAYAHNDQLMVRKGESVRKGQQIATVGATGNVTAPQLHFEIRKGTEAVNPADYIKGDAMSLFGIPQPDEA